MSDKLPWNVRIRCWVHIQNDTALVVPRILHQGGCFRPSPHLLTLNKMFQYVSFDVICRRKHKTVEVLEIIEATSEPKNIWYENARCYSRIYWNERNSKFQKILPP